MEHEMGDTMAEISMDWVTEYQVVEPEEHEPRDLSGFEI